MSQSLGFTFTSSATATADDIAAIASARCDAFFQGAHTMSVDTAPIETCSAVGDVTIIGYETNVTAERS